jgi:hypothetical protein
MAILGQSWWFTSVNTNNQQPENGQALHQRIQYNSPEQLVPSPLARVPLIICFLSAAPSPRLNLRRRRTEVVVGIARATTLRPRVALRTVLERVVEVADLVEKVDLVL